MTWRGLLFQTAISHLTTLRKVQKILPLALRSENLFSNLKSYFRPPYWISFEKTRYFGEILKAKMSENSDSLNPQSRVSNEGSNKEVNYIEIIRGFGNIYTEPIRCVLAKNVIMIIFAV